MWKRSNEIEGVSASSIVDLKAILYETEQARKRGDPIKKDRIKRKRTEEKANIGVEERNKRDELEQKNSEPNNENAFVKLKEKSKLYNKMKNEGNYGIEQGDTDKASIMVDFELKSWQKAEDKDDRESPKPASSIVKLLHDSSDEDEEEQPYRVVTRDAVYNPWDSASDSEKEYQESQDRKKRIFLYNELSKETEHGRNIVQDAKKRKKEELLRRKEKILAKTKDSSDKA